MSSRRSSHFQSPIIRLVVSSWVVIGVTEWAKRLGPVPKGAAINYRETVEHPRYAVHKILDLTIDIVREARFKRRIHLSTIATWFSKWWRTFSWRLRDDWACAISDCDVIKSNVTQPAFPANCLEDNLRTVKHQNTGNSRLHSITSKLSNITHENPGADSLL